METQVEIVYRWRYLRDLLIEQLGRFEAGALTLHANEVNISHDAIVTLKQNIGEFDELIGKAGFSADAEA